MNPRVAPLARLVPLAFATLLLAALLSGCASSSSDDDGAASSTPSTTVVDSYPARGFDGTTWPDLHGETVVLLDHGAFDYVFGPAKEKFEALTNGTLEHIASLDTGDALNRAIREKDAPSFDAVYGLDNAYLGKAVRSNALQPYKPVQAGKIQPGLVFFDPNGPWYATPADHGFIAVNVDPRAGLTVTDLDSLKADASSFVTQDPRTSSPGLGFLLSTIATYGEATAYDWHDYWTDLFDAGVTVTPDWTTAYATRFSGGYGQGSPGFVGDKPLVTSYTTSPAYERFYGANSTNGLVLAPKATFHQVETVAIAKNAKHPVAAQAFVEFVLSKDFQDLNAEYNAVYPVIVGAKVDDVYGGTDPAPGSFEDAGLSADALSGNVERWVNEWTDLYEAHLAG